MDYQTTHELEQTQRHFHNEVIPPEKLALIDGATDIKMNKWKLALPVLAIALFAAWYAIRPERLIINQRVNEAFPANAEASSAHVVKSGTFYGVMHPTMGTATIYSLTDGDRILRFTNFKTSNGPDVHVYLVGADDARDSATVKRTDFIDLGTIKGNIGDQNYALRKLCTSSATLV
jgi:hypothetical protein